MAMESKSPHFWWIISVMGVIIIVLLSFIVTNNIICAHIISEYISFASCLLSIILSIFAILYTYISNAQIQQQFDKINVAATTIQTASKDLMTTNVKLEQSLELILNTLKELDSGQQKMSSQISSIANSRNDNVAKDKLFDISNNQSMNQSKTE